MKLTILHYIFPSYVYSLLADKFINEHKKVLLPKKIGKYIFIKNLRENKTYPFAIGLYKFNKQKYVAKIWMSKWKDTHYYELEHEINTLKILKSIENRLKLKEKSFFRVSPFIESIKKDNYLVMMSSYVSGKPLTKIINVKKQIKIYFGAVNYIKLIGRHCSSTEKIKLRVRNIKFLSIIFPIIFTIALIKRRSVYKLLFNALKKYLINISSSINWDNLVLIHGDLHTENIYLSKKNYYIFDFEQTMFSYPQYEIAATLSSLRSNSLFLKLMLSKVRLFCKKDVDYQKKMETILIQCSTHNLISNLQEKSINVYIRLLKSGLSIKNKNIFNYSQIYMT